MPAQQGKMQSNAAQCTVAQYNAELCQAMQSNAKQCEDKLKASYTVTGKTDTCYGKASQGIDNEKHYNMCQIFGQDAK